MDHNELHELLSSPSKKVEQTSGLGGILAHLFRKILHDMNIETGRMDYNLTRYIEHARRTSADSALAANTNRGNLRRELARDTMTIKVFMKALRVLGVKKVRLIVELTHPHQEPTRHWVNVDIADDALFANDDKHGQDE